MNPAFAFQLHLKIWKTNVGTQKIDGTTLKTHGIIVSNFSMSDNDDRRDFLKKTSYWLQFNPK